MRDGGDEICLHPVYFYFFSNILNSPMAPIILPSTLIGGGGEDRELVLSLR